ncbi:hypothetical protein MSAN_02300800 [Mycena sanguinolenta]|uniref:Uncharacterized protein n=1 Tax=Mycena sanguinolenta TaxID=230812 RepID=A0A8H6X9J3_9AGAR|nr:hypothetical protein MSAN_02300800 [Mycena sanguinolenta]
MSVACLRKPGLCTASELARRGGISVTIMQSLRTVRRRLPPRIPAFHYPPGIRRSLATLAQTTVQAPGVHKTSCLDFYRTSIDLDPFSCDWDHFPFRRFFNVSSDWYDLTEMEFFVKRVANIQGTIRPLAYLPICDPCIIFEAGRKYYCLNTCTDYFEYFGGDFASDDRFLAALNGDPPIRGTIHDFPDNIDDLYRAVCREQRQRRRLAENSRKG